MTKADRKAARRKARALGRTGVSVRLATRAGAGSHRATKRGSWDREGWKRRLVAE